MRDGTESLTEEQAPRTEREWQGLALLLDRWVRFPAGRAFAADEFGLRLWGEKVAGVEVSDPTRRRSGRT